VPVLGTRRKLRTAFFILLVIKGYERNVGFIGENQHKCGLMTGIVNVKGIAGRIHLSCSGQPISST
jgi:hypothetical protein